MCVGEKISAKTIGGMLAAIVPENRKYATE